MGGRSKEINRPSLASEAAVYYLHDFATSRCGPPFRRRFRAKFYKALQKKKLFRVTARDLAIRRRAADGKATRAMGGRRAHVQQPLDDREPHVGSHRTRYRIEVWGFILRVHRSINTNFELFAAVEKIQETARRVA